MGVITDASAGVLATIRNEDDGTRTEVLAGDKFLDTSGRFVRHPCDVTADRLGNHAEKYADQLTPNELRAIATTLGALADIAQGRRA